jgi:hypothetical protein
MILGKFGTSKKLVDNVYATINRKDISYGFESSVKNN